MADDRTAWTSSPALPDQVAERFTTLSKQMGLSAGDLVERLATRVVKVDDELREAGLSGIAAWGPPETRIVTVVQEAVTALPIDVRPTGFMWPSDRPSPRTAEECKAVVIGYEMCWRGTFDDFNKALVHAWPVLPSWRVGDPAWVPSLPALCHRWRDGLCLDAGSEGFAQITAVAAIGSRISGTA